MRTTTQGIKLENSYAGEKSGWRDAEKNLNERSALNVESGKMSST